MIYLDEKLRDPCWQGVIFVVGPDQYLRIDRARARRLVKRATLDLKVNRKSRTGARHGRKAGSRARRAG